MINILRYHSLKNLNTFGVDVRAGYFTEIFSEIELEQILNYDEFKESNKFILGGGSNVLFTKDYDGLIIKNFIQSIRIIDENEKYVIVRAGAGVNWDDLVKHCVEKNWGGIENLSLIPGTVGAAPIQNIGAYGQELKNVFYNLEGVFIESGEKKICEISECNFDYRESVFKGDLKDKFIITKVSLKLSKKPEINISYPSVQEEIQKRKISKPSIEDIRKIVIDIRTSKLADPKIIGNAGSFFKNPVISINKFGNIKEKFPDLISHPVDKLNVKLPAAALIEKCGWKGKRVGNCGCYEKQPLVIVNYGGATADEILNLASSIKSSVEEKFEISLEPEVNLV